MLAPKLRIKRIQRWQVWRQLNLSYLHGRVSLLQSETDWSIVMADQLNFTGDLA
jgi:hypothetical protein